MNGLTQQWWCLVNFGFRLLYNELAFTYDLVSVVVSLGQWRCWQRISLEHLPPPDAGPVLEIAHGTGNLHLDLHTAGYDALGYDLSPQMGRITRNKLRRRGIKASLTRGYAQRLPYADDSFAAIVSTFPTDFIVSPETLRETHRILKSGGVLVVVLNGELTGSGPIARFIEWLYGITGQREGTDVEPTAFFRGYGFDVEAVEARCRGSRVQLVILRK